MTLAELAADVRMEAFVLGVPGDEPSARRLVVTMERWHGNAGDAFEHCPTVRDAQATVNGVEMSDRDPGGEYGATGCALPRFSLDLSAVPGAEGAPETVIEVRDASTTLRLVTTNMFAAPKVTWKSPIDGALHAGDEVAITVTPSPLGLISPDIIYESNATDTAAATTYPIAGTTMTATPSELHFVVPEAPAGAGAIMMTSGGMPLFGAGIVECKGAGSCFVARVKCDDAECGSFTQASLDAPVILPATIMP